MTGNRAGPHLTEMAYKGDIMTENALPAYRESLMPTIVHPTGGRSGLRSLSPAGHASGGGVYLLRDAGKLGRKGAAEKVSVRRKRCHRQQKHIFVGGILTPKFIEDRFLSLV